MNDNVTRGYGILEKFLAEQRSKIANKKINDKLRSGKLLDIGCGSYPFFLENINFCEKYGIDKSIKNNFNNLKEIKLINYDIEKELKIPFENEFFDVVTMLAVIEHIEPEKLIPIISEIFRVLKNDGVFIFTTPSGWTDSLLRFLAKIKLVSSVEIDEHKDVYNHSKLSSIFIKSGFNIMKMKFGYFEMFMNIWGKIEK